MRYLPLSDADRQDMLARIGVGVGEAGCTPTAHSLIADYVPKENRASATPSPTSRPRRRCACDRSRPRGRTSRGRIESSASTPSSKK